MSAAASRLRNFFRRIEVPACLQPNFLDHAAYVLVLSSVTQPQQTPDASVVAKTDDDQRVVGTVQTQSSRFPEFVLGVEDLGNVASKLFPIFNSIA